MILGVKIFEKMQYNPPPLHPPPITIKHKSASLTSKTLLEL